MTNYSESPTGDTQSRRARRASLKARSIWIFALAIAAIVVIEGFALSWGGDVTRPSRGSASSTVPAASSPNICAKGARFRFIQVDYLRYGGGAQPATVTGHVVTLHCGGLDDFQFLVHATPETVSLRASAKVTLMTLAPAFYLGTLKELNNYLAQDEDGNIFRVTGPDSGATALTAMFHP
jgi:hypothetical protein